MAQRRITEISPSKTEFLQKKYRVAAYCRVSTDHEEQDSSIELQEIYYSHLIQENPKWENAGIFSEKATGLDLKKRPVFQALMKQCKNGKVDLILTKSISRFGRNTLEMLRSLQMLQGLGVDVWFEKENLWLQERHLQLLLTIYCAFAQAESENMSQNIRWGIREGFRTGNSGYADFVCFGYKQGDGGKLVIDEIEAPIVRQIFEMRAAGESLGKISDWLYENRIASPSGRERWSRETISKLLKNEKYVGDVLLQKTFVEDLFSGRQIRNTGERDRYLIENHHPAILEKELFEQINKRHIKKM